MANAMKSLKMNPNQLRTALLITLGVLSLYSTYTLFTIGRQYKATKFTEKDVSEYSYVDDDFPTYFPMPPLSSVPFTPADDAQYSTTTPASFDAWLATSPPGTGMARLGPSHRPFFLAMFHQLHCLRYFRNTLANGGKGSPRWPHLHHCFTYLRQGILCDADTTLERGDWAEAAEGDGWRGEERTCKDWEEVYKAMKENWREWWALKDEIGYVDEPKPEGGEE